MPTSSRSRCRRQDRFDEEDDEFVFLHANQSRFGIKSKVDTAVGQIRSRIEMDFFCAGEVDRFRCSVSRVSGRPSARVSARPMANGT